MPISGICGAGGVLAIPGRKWGGDARNSSNSKPFRSCNFSTYNASIKGVTRDKSGIALAGCVVKLFVTSTDAFQSQTISDASGNYALYPSGAGPFYLVAYLAGAPDVAGTTIDSLFPS